MVNSRSTENKAIGYQSITKAIEDGKIQSGAIVVLQQFFLFPLLASIVCSSVYLYFFTEYINSEIYHNFMQDPRARFSIVVTFAVFSNIFMLLGLVGVVIIPAIIKSRFYATQLFFQKEMLALIYIDASFKLHEQSVEYGDIKYIKHIETPKQTRKAKTLFRYFLSGYLTQSKNAGIIEIHSRKKGLIQCCYTDLMLSDANIIAFNNECRTRYIRLK